MSKDAQKEAAEAKARESRLADAKYDLEEEHLMPVAELEARLHDDFQMSYEEAGEQLPRGFQYSTCLDVDEKVRNVVPYSMRKVLSRDHTILNKLTAAEKRHPFIIFLGHLTGFFSLLLWGGSLLCFIGYGLRADIDNLYLGIVLSTVVLLTGIFSFSQEAKSASLMAQFSKLMAQQIRCYTDKRPPLAALDEDDWQLNDREASEFDALHLLRGDVVMLRGGDSIPADIRILDSNNFKVDNSSLTGEPEALERNKHNTVDDPKEATNMAYFGCSAKEGTCTGVVLRVGDNTFIGKIAQLTESTEGEQTPINTEIHHFVSIVSAVAVFLGVTFFIIGLVIGQDLVSNLVFTIGIIVANVPEGLLATVTVCLTLTSASMASKNVLVRNMESVETLGSTTCICSDKTGTLTQNSMTLAETIFDKSIFRTDFVEGTTTGFDAIDSASPTFRMFHRAMCLNTTAKFRREEFSSQGRPFYLREEGGIPMVQWQVEGDASETGIIKFAQYMHPRAYTPGNMPYVADDISEMFNTDFLEDDRETNAMVGTIPFNSRNKYHVLVTSNADTPETPFTVWMKGAPERIMGRCDQMVLNGEVVELDRQSRSEINALQSRLMNMGRRVLAFAKYDMPADMVAPDYEFSGDAMNFPMGEALDSPTRAQHLESLEEKPDMREGFERLAHRKLTFIGMIALIDPPRPAVPAAVLSCQRAGIRVVMVTGDHPDTAAAIARMVNIFTSDDVKRMGPVRRQRVDDEGRQLFDENGDPVLEPCPDPCVFDREGKNIADSRSIVVPGWEFDEKTSDEKWRFIFSHDEVVFARTSPQQKLQIVERFQTMEREIVAVTGDGVNDAPALKRADIGVAMGIAGTEVSKTAADMILVDDNFASIVRGVEEGRLIFDNLKKSIAYTLSSNIPEIAPFLVFITVGTPLPLSTVLILCIDLGTDMVPAISMAWESAESDIMSRPARDAAVDRLVTKKLVVFAYLQIGVIQAAAGFFTWLVVLNDYGYPPHILPGLGSFDNWGKQVLYCQLTGGIYRNAAGDVYNGSSAAAAAAAGYSFWDSDTTGVVEQCTYAAKNFLGEIETNDNMNVLEASTYENFSGELFVVTDRSIRALKDAGFVEFMPYQSVQSPFWQSEWLAWDVTKPGVPGAGEDVDATLIFGAQLPGVFTVDDSSLTSEVARGSTVALDKLASDKVFSRATFTQPTTDGQTLELGYVTKQGDTLLLNVASRMMQKEALHHAQCAYFISIIVVQYADLLICRTRWLSIYSQGMNNAALNFGLLFETLLGAALCYLPGIGDALGTRPLRALHWMPAVPFSIAIMLYDEIRKYIMRSRSVMRKQGLQQLMEYSWLSRQTYW